MSDIPHGFEGWQTNSLRTNRRFTPVTTERRDDSAGSHGRALNEACCSCQGVGRLLGHPGLSRRNAVRVSGFPLGPLAALTPSVDKPARTSRIEGMGGAHVGGFIFGLVVARTLVSAGRVQPQDYGAALGAPA